MVALVDIFLGLTFVVSNIDALEHNLNYFFLKLAIFAAIYWFRQGSPNWRLEMLTLIMAVSFYEAYQVIGVATGVPMMVNIYPALITLFLIFYQ